MRFCGAVLVCCFFALRGWAMAPAEAQFDISAQSLSSALLEFSGQSGLQVLAADALVADRRSRAVSGRMPAITALQRLLSGTGLTYRRVDASTIALVRAAGPLLDADPEAGEQSRIGPVTAGVAPTPGAENPPEVAEIQVTGTRIQVPRNYTAANPILSITGDELLQLGIVNVSDAIATLVPQNIPSYQPALTGDDQEGSIRRGSYFVGNTIANLRGMDPTFGSRTLTMIDGRRVVSTSNQADVIDLNIIPSNLLRRMDVVTGGASATYGSGAMAGVVNLVLNHQLHGINIDLDYGVNETGDGGSPHIGLAAGSPLFGGRAHMLFGAEWQQQSAIRDCAAARDWCARSRTLYQNFSGSQPDPSAPVTLLPGFEAFPARFRAENVRYSQYAPAGAIYSSGANNTSGYRFTADGTGVEEYAYGYRGGTGRNTLNGDGPLITTGLPLRPSNGRTSLFTSIEFNLTGRVTGYLQGSYARTEARNRNRHTDGSACVRFNDAGVTAEAGGSARAGEFIAYGGDGEAFRDPVTDAVWNDLAPRRNPLWNNANFRLALGNAPSGRTAPYFIRPGQSGSTEVTPPFWQFTNGINPVWQRITSAQGTAYWNLVGVTLTVDFSDPGSPAVLPKLGRNAYAFLEQLDPEALLAVQTAFNNSATTGGGPGLDNLYGPTPCSGHTALRKVWSPQVQQWTEQQSETLRMVAGARGGLRGDWRWDAYYQYGETESTSRQNSVQTNLSFAFAMDAVVDDREFLEGAANPGYGQPVCRILRDGVPVLDAAGRPTSDPQGLAALAAGCQPLNIFGTTFADQQAARRQQLALAYAFKDSISDGANRLHTFSASSSGTLWRGWAGPLTGALGIELREDHVDNQGTRGSFYERADFARAWGDAFGGRTRVSEGYTELDLPIVAKQPGLELWSVNAGVRYASYHNKGGAGTTGQSATQGTTNWKFSTVVEPFDWVRLRLTRSRDLRAAGYRDLFLSQPGVPDSEGGQQARNPWRTRAADSEENQYERWGTVSVGNPDLVPERSDTLTLGMVLAPSGWAQGMRLSADYYTIKVKRGIYTSYGFMDPVLACWQNSGNVEASYRGGEMDPDNPGINGLFDDTLTSCREITFALNEDGTRNLNDIVALDASRPVNGLPYQRRGLDLAWNQGFTLESFRLPGVFTLTVRATRALESSGIQHTCLLNAGFTCVDEFKNVDLAGQIRSNTFIPGVSASPKWTGNVISSYRHAGMTLSLSTRYIGGARLDNSWTDDPADAGFRNAAGDVLSGSVDRNRVPAYFNFSLNGAYDLQRNPAASQLQLFASINNLFDKSPPFTGGGISGASAQYHDTMGRAYRLGARMRF